MSDHDDRPPPADSCRVYPLYTRLSFPTPADALRSFSTKVALTRALLKKARVEKDLKRAYRTIKRLNRRAQKAESELNRAEASGNAMIIESTVRGARISSLKEDLAERAGAQEEVEEENIGLRSRAVGLQAQLDTSELAKGGAGLHRDEMAEMLRDMTTRDYCARVDIKHLKRTLAAELVSTMAAQSDRDELQLELDERGAVVGDLCQQVDQLVTHRDALKDERDRLTGLMKDLNAVVEDQPSWARPGEGQSRVADIVKRAGVHRLPDGADRRGLVGRRSLSPKIYVVGSRHARDVVRPFPMDFTDHEPGYDHGYEKLTIKVTAVDGVPVPEGEEEP